MYERNVEDEAADDEEEGEEVAEAGAGGDGNDDEEDGNDEDDDRYDDGHLRTDDTDSETSNSRISVQIRQSLREITNVLLFQCRLTDYVIGQFCHNRLLTDNSSNEPQIQKMPILNCNKNEMNASQQCQVY